MDSSQQRMLNLSLVHMQPLKTVYGRFPTTDAALLLIRLQDLRKQFMDSSQQRMLTYHLFRLLSTFENSLRILQNMDVNLSLV